MKKVYLDNCIYNRPFDDQTKEIIFIEANAFYLILEWIEKSKIITINSDVLIYENEMNLDTERKIKILTYLSLAKQYILLSNKIISRAEKIVGLGFEPIDSLHIAMAESSNADYFITCDYDIIKEYDKVKDKIKVKIIGILEFVKEEIENENN